VAPRKWEPAHGLHSVRPGHEPACSSFKALAALRTSLRRARMRRANSFADSVGSWRSKETICSTIARRSVRGRPRRWLTGWPPFRHASLSFRVVDRSDRLHHAVMVRRRLVGQANATGAVLPGDDEHDAHGRVAGTRGQRSRVRNGGDVPTYDRRRTATRCSSCPSAAASASRRRPPGRGRALLLDAASESHSPTTVATLSSRSYAYKTPTSATQALVNGGREVRLRRNVTGRNGGRYACARLWPRLVEAADHCGACIQRRL
jgi:hypothetical protein